MNVVHVFGQLHACSQSLRQHLWPITVCTHFVKMFPL